MKNFRNSALTLGLLSTFATACVFADTASDELPIDNESELLQLESEAKQEVASTNVGWLANETEFRHFRMDMNEGGKHNDVEINWMLLHGSIKFTEDTSLWMDLRKIDYYSDAENGDMKRTGFAWDHEALLYTKVGTTNWLGKDWDLHFGFGWEGDWNYSGNRLNWSSQDFYPLFDMNTSFSNGLTPWDNGQHHLTFRPILSEFITFGEVSKFHSGGHYHGNRQQVASFFLSSQWTDKLSTFLSFRNYLDTLAGDGVQYHYGSESYLHYDFYRNNGFFVQWKNKLEFYLGMEDEAKTGKDEFVEFYTRIQAGYEKTLENKITVKAYIGQDLWDYHYNARPWIDGKYSRLETIASFKVNIPLG